MKIDTYRMGEITARLAERVAELEALAYELAGEEFMLGSTQQVGARPVRAARPHRRAARARPATRPTRRCCARSAHEHAIVPVIEEWRELSKLLNTYLGPLPALIDEPTGRLHTTINQTVAATGRLSTTSPNLQSIPIRTELGREIRSRLHRRGGRRSCSRPTTRRSSCASSRTSPASRSCARRSRAARTSTARPPPRCSARIRRR